MEDSPTNFRVSAEIEKDAFGILILLTVPLVIAYASCVSFTKQSAYRFHHFKLFGAAFLFHAVATTIGGLDCFVRIHHSVWIRSHIGICSALMTSWWYANSLLPIVYMWFILHTLFGLQGKGRTLTTRLVPALIIIISFYYFVDAFIREQTACSTGEYTRFSWHFMIVGECAEAVSVLLLIGSFFCLYLNELQSLHRQLLIVAVAVQIPANVMFENRSHSENTLIVGAWFILPLFYPIVYLFVVRKHEQEQVEEEDKTYLSDDISLI